MGRPDGGNPDREMNEREWLLALLDCYDAAIRELYVMDDHALLGLILRLERRRKQAEAHLNALNAIPEIAPVAAVAAA